MSGTMIPLRASVDSQPDEPRRTISGQQRIGLPRELLDATDVEGFVDGALDEHPPVPITEGTVMIARFESPALDAVDPPAKAAPKAALSRLHDVVDLIPPRHAKLVAAATLFFSLLGVVTLLAGVTILLFVL